MRDIQRVSQRDSFGKYEYDDVFSSPVLKLGSRAVELVKSSGCKLLEISESLSICIFIWGFKKIVGRYTRRSV